MKRMFVVLVLVVVCIVCLGFYQGWFELSENTADGKVNVTLKVDENKIKVDQEKVEKKMHDLGHTAQEKIGGGRDGVND